MKQPSRQPDDWLSVVHAIPNLYRTKIELLVSFEGERKKNRLDAIRTRDPWRDELLHIGIGQGLGLPIQIRLAHKY